MMSVLNVYVCNVVDEEYIFLALGTACDVCKRLNEQHFKVKDMMPGENAPPMHPNCRCSTAAYMDGVRRSWIFRRVIGAESSIYL